MRKIKKISLAIALLSASSLALSMQMLDEEQLGDVTGEGLGTVFEDLAIDSDDYRTYPNSAFKVKLRLNDDGFVYAKDANGDIIRDAYGPVILEDNNEYVVLSELRMHKARSTIERLSGETDEAYEARVRRTGGFIGTVKNPLVQEQIVELDYDGNTMLLLESSYPGKDIEMVERSFFNHISTGWTGKKWGSSLVGGNVGGINDRNRAVTNGQHVYRGFPEQFFDAGAVGSSVPVGNFFTVANQFNQNLEDFEARLDLVSDKFDMHLRVDAITDVNKNFNSDDQFLSYLDLIGMRYYGKKDYAWTHPTYGFVTTGWQGLRVDELRLTTDVTGAQSSIIAAKGVDIYLPGSLAQPHVTSIVMYDQFKRGEWKQGNRVGEALPQLRTEIVGLTTENPQAPQGHVIIQQLNFGDPNDPELITGREDIYLRDNSGTVVAKVDDVVHRAFIPKTVIYNEQIDKYNAEHNTNLPNIPNQNVIEVRGLEIQRQVMITQDLGR